MTLTDIVANIDRRLSDLDAEMTQLTAARAALSATSAHPTESRPVRGRRAAVTPRRAAVTPRYDVAPAGKLLALLSDSDGMSTRELSRAANADPDQVLGLLKEQVDADQVRRSGTRAGTRWHAVTDESRIAARVAELEAASRRSRARKH